MEDKDVATFIVALLVAAAAFIQAGIAWSRHLEQTYADLQRRLSESFAKATEQLSKADSLPTRVGAIFTLERISKESLDLYWPVMETLTAFLRTEARWVTPLKEDGTPGPDLPMRSNSKMPVEWKSHHPDLPIDIAAVLDVLKRRSRKSRRIERKRGFRFNLSFTDLRGADLRSIYLQDAELIGTQLQGAKLQGGYFEDADFEHANLSWSVLDDAHFNRSTIRGMRIEHARVKNADFSGVNLSYTYGLETISLNEIKADLDTAIPQSYEWPKSWPAPRYERSVHPRYAHSDNGLDASSREKRRSASERLKRLFRAVVEVITLKPRDR